MGTFGLACLGEQSGYSTLRTVRLHCLGNSRVTLPSGHSDYLDLGTIGLPFLEGIQITFPWEHSGYSTLRTVRLPCLGNSRVTLPWGHPGYLTLGNPDHVTCLHIYIQIINYSGYPTLGTFRTPCLGNTRVRLRNGKQQRATLYLCSFIWIDPIAGGI